MQPLNTHWLVSSVQYVMGGGLTGASLELRDPARVKPADNMSSLVPEIVHAFQRWSSLFGEHLEDGTALLANDSI